MATLGLGIIGLHHQHPRWYFPLWAHLPQYKPVAVSEADEEFLEAEKGFFGLDAVTDYRAVLGRDDVDVVIIWLPHSEMPTAVAAAAEAGKHVIVEKPCAADLAGAEAIAATAAAHPEIKISAPYCWRTHPVSVELRKAVDTGLLGDLLAMEGRLNAGGAHRYVRDNALWMLKDAEGGGPMWNLGVHWIDYFRWLTGNEIVSIAGVTSGPVGGPARDIVDSAQAVMTLDGGATAMLDISYGVPDSYPGKRDIYVSFRGTCGAAAWAPAWEGVTDELLLVSGHGAGGEETCRTLEIVSKDIPGYCGHMAWAWLTDFAEAVAEDRAPCVSVDDILAAVKVVDAFKRSIKSRKTESV